MRRNVALWMLAMALTATTFASAGDTAQSGAACSTECKPCPWPCDVPCPPCD